MVFSHGVYLMRLDTNRCIHWDVFHWSIRCVDQHLTLGINKNVFNRKQQCIHNSTKGTRLRFRPDPFHDLFIFIIYYYISKLVFRKLLSISISWQDSKLSLSSCSKLSYISATLVWLSWALGDSCQRFMDSRVLPVTLVDSRAHSWNLNLPNVVESFISLTRSWRSITRTLII